jgi:hypothetical protein
VCIAFGSARSDMGEYRFETRYLQPAATRTRLFVCSQVFASHHAVESQAERTLIGQSSHPSECTYSTSFSSRATVPSQPSRLAPGPSPSCMRITAPGCRSGLTRASICDAGSPANRVCRRSRRRVQARGPPPRPVSTEQQRPRGYATGLGTPRGHARFVALRAHRPRPRRG